MNSLDLLESIYNGYRDMAYVINEYMNPQGYAKILQRKDPSSEHYDAQMRRGKRIHKIRKYVRKMNPAAEKAAADLRDKVYQSTPKKAQRKGYSAHGSSVQAQVDANSMSARAIKKALKNPPAKF